MSVDPVSLGITLALDAASMALTASQRIEGPRLDNLAVTNADYGASLYYFHGTRMNDGPLVIFAENLREVKHTNKTKGGKYNEYKYYGTWAVMFADHQVDQVLKIWFDEHLVYDMTGAGPVSPFTIGSAGQSVTSFMRIYLGSATQDPDPRMLATIEARNGAGSCPAYRNCAYVMFEELPLEKLGNRLPQIKVLATNNGTPTYPYDIRTSPIHSPQLGITFAADYSRITWVYGNSFETWDIAGRALMISATPGSPFGPTSPLVVYDQPSDGRIYVGYGNDVLSYAADGIGGSSTVFTYSAPLLAARALDYGVLGQILTFAIPLSLFGGYHVLAYNGLEVTTLSQTGVDWLPHDAFKDSFGDIWAVGSTGSTICLYCLTDENGRIGDLIQVAAPTSPGGNPHTYAFHYADATLNQFVVSWNETHFVTIDMATGAITNTASIALVSAFPAQVRNVLPSTKTFWIGGGSSISEYSSVDLLLIRTVSLSTWHGSTLNYVVYDPINNALIGTEGSGGVGAVTTAWYYLDRTSGGGVTLQSIVEDVATRCGLDIATDIDATALDQSVLGYSWTQGSAKAIIEPLMEFYNSEARPHDFLLEFHKRGGSGALTVQTSKMGASQDGKDTRYKISRTLDSDLPLKVSVTTADPSIDQQPNTLIAQRNMTSVDSSREVSLDLSTLAIDATSARAGADTYLRRTWYGQETYELSITRQFTGLEPGDVQTLEFDGIYKVAKLTQMTVQADGVFATKWIRDKGAIHTSPAQPGAPATGIFPPTIPIFGYTKGFLLDTPLVTDADEGIITYLAAGPYSSGTSWPGAIFYQSLDAGVTYDTELDQVASDHVATWGSTAGALPDALSSVWDHASSVTVVVQEGTLSSATETAVLNGANRALIGDEQVGFTTATLTAPLTYSLSGFLRGRRGTEWATSTHAAGDRFVLLNSSLVRHVHGASDVGTTLYVKPVTAGQITASGFPQTFAYHGRSAMPYAPAHLKVVAASGDKVATWVRRTRIGGDWRDYNDASLGEGSEAYEADVINGSGTVIRTFTGLTAPTLTYTAAQISTDAGAGVNLVVYQISTTVGRGFPATVAL